MFNDIQTYCHELQQFHEDIYIFNRIIFEHIAVLCCVLRFTLYDLSDMLVLFCFLHLQQYNYQNDDSPPHDPGFLRLTSEVTPELVHVSEKNLSEIENVHGYVSHSHISPLKVSLPDLYFFCFLFAIKKMTNQIILLDNTPFLAYFYCSFVLLAATWFQSAYCFFFFYLSMLSLCHWPLKFKILKRHKLYN